MGGNRRNVTLTGVPSAIGRDAGPEPVPQLFQILHCDHPLEPGSRHLLDQADRVTIGRGAERSFSRSAGGALAIEIDDGRASARHAELTRDDDGWWIADAGSKNGTHVNGAAIERVRLSDRDVVLIGRTVFLFRDRAPVRPATPSDVEEAALAAPTPDWATFHDPLAAGYAAAARIAATTVPVLVLGDTGTGKEVVARSLHALSRREGQCVAVNCAAIPETLVESELFGHRKGAFTGADTERLGWMRSADGGTLFLDEIGELRPQSQAALLRALETREVVPVGTDRPVPVDFRLVAATNRDLEVMVAEGRFRSDLRARLGACVLQLPTLAARIEDLGLLLRSILRREAAEEITLRGTAAVQLLQHGWPGNVRELVHVITHARAQAGGEAIGPQHLPASLRRPAALTGRAAPEEPSSAGDLREELASLEKRRIEEALARHPTLERAAKSLGVPLRTFYNRLDALGISRGKSKKD